VGESGLGTAGYPQCLEPDAPGIFRSEFAEAPVKILYRFADRPVQGKGTDTDPAQALYMGDGSARRSQIPGDSPDIGARRAVDPYFADGVLEFQ